MNNILSNLGKPFASLFDKYAAIVFFDVETTGLNPATDRITEIAAVRLERPLFSNAYQETKKLNILVKLPAGQKIPENIISLTGITDEMLETQGVPESIAARMFHSVIIPDKGPVLLVAHNAHFDLRFVECMFDRQEHALAMAFYAVDYLDSKTVFSDRSPYRHSLSDAIKVYALSEMAQNSHRALDDARALLLVCAAMAEERDDLLSYVNLFGFSPEYGIQGAPLLKVMYRPQTNPGWKTPEETLPALVKKEREIWTKK